MTDRAPAYALATEPVLPGTWKLARGRAITLRPVTDGILRIAHGRVWATMDGPHGRTPDDAGDHMLQVGRSLYIRAGRRVVIEAWNRSGASYFVWDPVLATAPAAARPAIALAALLQPLADLRAALGLAGRALGQLATGLAGLGWALARSGLRALPGRRPQGLAG